MLRFASQLAQGGVTVSFVCQEGSIPRLTASSPGGGDSPWEQQSPNLRFLTLQWPEGEGALGAKPFKEAFEPLMEKLMRDKNAGVAGRPTCVIADMFLPWSADVAEKLQVLRYMLVTSGMIFARFIQGTLEYFERGQFQASEADGKLVEFDWPVRVPGLSPLRFAELDSFLLLDPQFFRLIAESFVKSAGVLANSFLELEEEVIEIFRHPGGAGHEHITVPKVYPIGPLFSTTHLTGSSNVNKLEDSRTHCLSWLDSQPPSSVLYVAFGSMIVLRPEQIAELAYGLEASNQRFLWACPVKKAQHSQQESPSSIAEVLPPGFQARVGDRGCIVTGWAPQLEILAHSSTGGFFTHCGWNSSLESLMFGVPMIAWPQGAEQHINCNYLVDHLKVAERLQTVTEGVQRTEVERAVRNVMEGKEIRTRAEEIRRKAAAAVGEGGSQTRYVQEFLDDITSLKYLSKSKDRE